MYELLPCPFCGSTELDYNLDTPTFNDDFDEYNYWIECLECPCCMDLYSNNVYEIIEKWNTRV